ncbi:hypothetical protein GCM10025784_05580 [Citricoccus nitrophenolicus]
MAISKTLSVHFKCDHSETKGFPFTLPGKRKTKGLGPGRNLVCSRSFRASRRDELGEHHQDQLIRVQGFDGDHSLSGLASSDKQVPGDAPPLSVAHGAHQRGLDEQVCFRP